MEHIDQEGHQLPKKGQTMSRMSSASLPFTNTNDIGSLWWRSVSAEGRSMFRTKKKTAFWGKWTLDWFEIMTLWSWPLHMSIVSGLIRRYANVIIRWTSSLSLPLHMVILRTRLSLAPEFTMLIDLFPYNPWESVPNTFAFVWGARLKVTFTELRILH